MIDDVFDDASSHTIGPFINLVIFLNERENCIDVFSSSGNINELFYVVIEKKKSEIHTLSVGFFF